MDEKTDSLIFGGRENLIQIQRSKVALYLYVGKCNANLQIYICKQIYSKLDDLLQICTGFAKHTKFACLQYVHCVFALYSKLVLALRQICSSSNIVSKY